MRNDVMRVDADLALKLSQCSDPKGEATATLIADTYVVSDADVERASQVAHDRSAYRLEVPVFWTQAHPHTKEQWREGTRATLTAFLAALRARGEGV